MGSRQQFEEWARKMSMDLEYRNIPGVGQFYECPRTLLALEAWNEARESVALELPEITKDHIFFALNCHMEDPSDDEEDGFNAGVSWCRAFLKQQIAKRSGK